ncbi:MAG: hypothetical protein P8Y70_05135 [Candidatus Lokiarchaeota archaeon]
MEVEDKDSETKKLAEILSAIQNIYEQKKEQLEQLESEISELRKILRDLNSIISTKSFFSADQLYEGVQDNKVQEGNIDETELFQKKVSKEKLKNTKIKRKIFSDEDERNLLAILNLTDLNNLEIKFFDPKEKNIKETSERFIKIFLKDALIHVKEKNPEIEVNYDYYRNSSFIEKVLISNIQSIDEFDLITSKVKELLE